MKKPNFGRIVRYNVIFVAALLILAELYAYCYTFYRLNFNQSHTIRTAVEKLVGKGKMIFPGYFFTHPAGSLEEYYSGMIEFRPAVDPCENGRACPKKKPIVAFGCSFTWGQGLEEHQTWPHKLAHAMKRPVINLGYQGWGIQHMLWMLESGWGGVEEMEEPEFAIFMFIPDHVRRLSSLFGVGIDMTLSTIYRTYPYPTYVESGGRLVPKKYPRWLKGFHFLGWFDYKWISNKLWGVNSYGISLNPRIMIEMAELTKAHFIQAQEAMKKRWPNARMVVLNFGFYFDDKGFGYIWDRLEDRGIKVFNLRDLTGVDLKAKEWSLDFDPVHPSEKAWDLAVPLIMRELKKLTRQGA